VCCVALLQLETLSRATLVPSSVASQTRPAMQGEEEEPDVLERLRSSVIGSFAPLQTPLWSPPVVYADWTATGRAVAGVERFVVSEVLPVHANSHSIGGSLDSRQSSAMRDEARAIVQEQCGADRRHDAVLFAGSGATGAVARLVAALGLDAPLPAGMPPEKRPVVFVGPFEHHSNELPWRESCADVVRIPSNMLGFGLDQEALKVELEKCKERPLRVGSFSACSNLTGVLEDVNAVSAILHRGGALACWDYAAAAPYVKIEMNPVLPSEHPDRAFCYKDAICISPHKFVGGVNTPGLLIIKKDLLHSVPSHGYIGGGTVFFVRDSSHRYSSQAVEREEGGSPDCVGAIRVGLAFALKRRVGLKTIAAMETRNIQMLKETLRLHPKVVLLGPDWAESFGRRLPIISFLIKSDKSFLHYNFVTALLNDLFGIQARGGCMCAGPYAQELLGMPEDVVSSIEDALVSEPKTCESLRPGFVRLSLSYFASKEEVQYILQAVSTIAEHGWKLLPLYRINFRNGVWMHKSRQSKFPERIWLGDANVLGDNSANFDNIDVSAHPVDFIAAMKQALIVLMDEIELAKAENLSDQRYVFPAKYAHLRWFDLPSESLARLNGKEITNVIKFEDVEEEVEHVEHDPIPIDPYRYWELISPRDGVTSQKNDCTTPDNGKEKGIEGRTMCIDGSCFRSRKDDQYPSRSANEIQNEERRLMRGKSRELGPMNRVTPPRGILKNVGKAIAEWRMIEDGDRLLLGLSGGKDSLALLHVLLHLQEKAPVNFQVAACTIDPMTESFDPSPLIAYMESLGVTYHFVKKPIFENAKDGSLQGTSICSYCARMKRGALYECAREHGYKKLVLAQHLDDLAESTLMGMFHNGHTRSMMANYVEKGGKTCVIRPFIYVRESETREFSYSANLPVINENCPACFEAPKERERVKQLLAREEAMYPTIFASLKRALMPLMDPEVIDTMNRVTKDRKKLSATQERKKRSHDAAKHLKTDQEID